MTKRNEKNPTRDSGKVRLGGVSPSLPKKIADAGKVRLGGVGPAL